MSSFTRRIVTRAPFVRSIAIAALTGTTMLASPPTDARADNATNAAIQLAQAAGAQRATSIYQTGRKGR